MVVAEMNTGAILGRALAFPLTLIALYFWKRSKAVPDEPVEPVPTPQPTSGGKMSSGLSSHGPDGVVANFRIECPVLGCNEVFSTKAAADVWLEEHKQRCPFHAGALPETRVPGEPITAWDAWNCSKWRSRWWWSEGTREWQLIATRSEICFRSNWAKFIIL